MPRKFERVNRLNGFDSANAGSRQLLTCVVTFENWVDTFSRCVDCPAVLFQEEPKFRSVFTERFP